MKSCQFQLLISKDKNLIKFVKINILKKFTFLKIYALNKRDVAKKRA